MQATTVDPARIRKVCLALGPYRNLTTLTAGILALHPECQVLNHAGVRLLPDPACNFLAEPGGERMQAFLRRALELSAGGERGQMGGSITKSHAFDPPHPLGRLYRERYGSSTLKAAPTCLFWKESLHATNFLRREGIDLGRLFEREPRLCFLMPIRNPLDCALSNIRTEHTRYFEDLPPGAGLLQVLDRILDQLHWAAELRRAYPDRVFLYSQLEFTPRVLTQLACFLDLEPEPRWIEDALAAFDLRPGYAHAAEDLAAYGQLVRERFADHPELRATLEAFAIPGRV